MFEEANVNVFVIRHGETAWSLDGRHTGTTDLPLTDNGRRLARRLKPVLARNAFSLRFAAQCDAPERLANWRALVMLRSSTPILVEWDYGDYEGLTSKQIHEVAPGWLVFRDGCPAGETPEQVAARVDRVIARSRAIDGDVVLFAHGHVLRVLAARCHPSDERTGLSFSLIPMTQAIIGGLFTPAQVRRHLALIREHLLFPDGVRLMDRPLAYHGGTETIFRRAESAAFFGREVGLMYVHSHLRYAEAMSVLGEREAMWDALLVANPIAATDRLPHASLRQRNAYFSSSDAAFRDRYKASAEWERVKTGDVAADGGWRIYSSGPGLYVYLLIQHAFGIRRRFGKRIVEPGLPASQEGLDPTGLPPGASAAPR